MEAEVDTEVLHVWEILLLELSVRYGRETHEYARSQIQSYGQLSWDDQHLFSISLWVLIFDFSDFFFKMPWTVFNIFENKTAVQYNSTPKLSTHTSQHNR